jgi:hypothetical protein
MRVLAAILLGAAGLLFSYWAFLATFVWDSGTLTQWVFVTAFGWLMCLDVWTRFFSRSSGRRRPAHGRMSPIRGMTRGPTLP